MMEHIFLVVTKVYFVFTATAGFSEIKAIFVMNYAAEFLIL